MIDTKIYYTLNINRGSTVPPPSSYLGGTSSLTQNSSFSSTVYSFHRFLRVFTSPSYQHIYSYEYTFTPEISNNNCIEEPSHDDKTRIWQRCIVWLQTMGWVNPLPHITRFRITHKAPMVRDFALCII